MNKDTYKPLPISKVPDESKRAGWTHDQGQRDFAARFAHTAPKLDGAWISDGRLPDGPGVRPNGQLGTDHFNPQPTRIEIAPTLRTGGHTPFWGWPEDSKRKTYTLIGE